MSEQDPATVRARDLGVPFDGEPGRWNAITDVDGVAVGSRTRIEGTHEEPGEGPVVRTGVTAVHPLGIDAEEGVAAGRFVLNGMGEMTGTAFLDEYGALYGPLALTNTLSVGVVRDALIAWSRDRGLPADVLRGRTKPVVSETWDGRLNDAYGQHLGRDDAFAALDAARSGPVEEGNVGGGTGMIAFDFKAGTGTASRRVAHPEGRFVVAALVQANFGRRRQLRIAGVPVGRELTEPLPRYPDADPTSSAHGDGSIVVVLASDAPLLPSHLGPLAKRATLGLGRVGSIAATSSGDLFLAFSTGVRSRYGDLRRRRYDVLATESLDPLFEAAVQVVEESIVNALVAAVPMTGIDGAFVPSLPHARLCDVLTLYGRWNEMPKSVPSDR